MSKFQELITSSSISMYIKGFKVSREKIAKTFDLTGPMDPKVGAYIGVIVDMINRDGFKYLGSVLRSEPDEDWVDLVFVLDDAYDAEELKSRTLGPIDETIQSALPLALEGPEVWERWG